MLALGLLLATLGTLAAAQPKPREPSPAQEDVHALILIAAPGLPDRNFARSVVLVTNTPVGEIIGVILNRPTAAPWPRGLRPAEQTADGRMHFGGPLIPAATFAVGATSQEVTDTLSLGEGLRFAVGLKNTRALAQAGAPDGQLKLFNGYAGWGPGQLEAEIAAGVWQVRPVTAELVFDAEPATQWERLTALKRAVRAPALDHVALAVVPLVATGWIWP